MAIIRIVANGIELDFVRETLKIKKENNSFISTFKVSYNSYPFLIIENSKTASALGTREMTSVLKNKIVPVFVYEMGIPYYGELEIISYISGFRKCNLRFGSDILQIINSKIGSFMPIISISNESEEESEGSVEPFTEESTEIVPGYGAWETYPDYFLQRNFPQVKWNFPTIAFPDKYIEDIEPEDAWYSYQKHLNKYEETLLIMNDYEYITSSNIKVQNKNVVVPCVYLLSPLYYAFSSIGWKIKGDFINSPFVRRILMYVDKTQMTKTKLLPEVTSIVFDGEGWEYAFIIGFHKVEQYLVTAEGSHTIRYSFEIPPVASGSKRLRFLITHPSYETLKILDVQVSSNNGQNYIFQGEETFNAGEDLIGENINIYYSHMGKVMPISYSCEIYLTEGGREFNYPHPTIDFSRYVPAWTLPNYINQMKNLFNLDVTLDDFKKEITLNFVEPLFETEIKERIFKSLSVKGYDAAPYKAFVLKYENNEDNFIYIQRSGTTENFIDNSPLVNTIENAFKKVPQNNLTALISEDFNDKSGVGLMIYEPLNKPYTQAELNGQSLEMNSIYEFYWKKTLKVRINAGLVELEGPFTETEIGKILNSKRIYIDNQAYIVISLEYGDTRQENYNVTFKLESITF